MEKAFYQKYFVSFLNETFEHHNDNTLCKVIKGITVMKSLRLTLPWKCLLTIYKIFLRLVIYYGNIIYDQRCKVRTV